MTWSGMLLVGNGKLSTSKSKSSTLWYILVINQFSSVAISKPKKNIFMVLHTSSSNRSRIGINIFGSYHKIIDVILITNPNIIYISTYHHLTLSHPDDGITVIQNPSPSRPDDGSPIIQKKLISKNHN